MWSSNDGCSGLTSSPATTATTGEALYGRAELLVVLQADVEDYLDVYAPPTIDILRVLGSIGYLKLMLYCY